MWVGLDHGATLSSRPAAWLAKLTPWSGFIVFGAVAAVPMALSVWLFRKRDA